MTYRELLNLYKEGKLEEEKQKQVERDIERQDAISEYLFDREECAEPELFEMPQKDEEEDEFVRKIQDSIRKTFLKMGAIVGVSVLGIVLFVLFLLPQMVSLFYYDPGKIASKSLSGNTINQMSMDMGVYTELMLPGYLRDNVSVEEKGYGNYDISIWQNVSMTDSFTNVAGKVERGKLTLYDINALKPMIGNEFDWFQREDPNGSLRELDKKEAKEMQEMAEIDGEEEYVLTHGPITREGAKEKLQGLEENRYYLAYVTLDQMMDYNTFLKFIHYPDSYSNVWCAVRTNGDEREGFSPKNVGFYCNPARNYEISWDEEKYPNLFGMWKENETVEEYEQRVGKESFAKEHFVSLLNYMADQERFRKMMVTSDVDFAQAARYVEKNGIKIYGFVLTAKKEELLELDQREEVYVMDVHEL